MWVKRHEEPEGLSSKNDSRIQAFPIVGSLVQSSLFPAIHIKEWESTVKNKGNTEVRTSASKEILGARS